MSVRPPILDPRDQSALLEELRVLTPGYVPELTPADGTAALALMKVFARFASSLSAGLNRTPARQQLAFLDMLGTHLLASRAARVPLVFSLLETSPHDVTLPAGSQAAAIIPPPAPSAGGAPAPPNEPLVFATERTITLTRSRLVALYGIDPGSDTFTDHSVSLASGFELLGEGETTEHALYLGHDHLFALSGEITVLLLFSLGNEPERPLQLAWEYLTDAGWLPLVREELEDTTLGLRVDGQVALRRDCGPDAKKETIFGRTSFWIRGRLLTPLTPSSAGTKLPVINDMRARLNFQRKCLAPDAAFADGASLDVSKDFLPFGQQPKRFATFYVASKDVFQRKGARVSMDFALSVNGTPDGARASGAAVPASYSLMLAWEFFDGSNWVKLGVTPPEESEKRYLFDGNQQIAFTCPPDWAESEVNGKKNFWMRVRIINGDYGHPVRAVVPATGNSKLEADSLAPPVVRRLQLGYAYLTDPEVLDHCLSYNDFVFSDHTHACQWPDQTFTPLRPVADTQPAIHFGFTRALPAGLVSLYADVAPGIGDEERDSASPYVWEYGSPRGWTELGVLDDTNGMRRSGLIQFIGPPDAVARTGLGGDLFRVRARLKRGERAVASSVNGVWLNSVWASQRAIAERELLGTSDGNAGQTFRTQRAPMLDPERVEVEEWTGRGESWRLWFDGVPEDAIRVERDAVTGDATAVWVRWTLRPHHYRSLATDRHYTVERATGTIRFGDGTNGMIPPASRRIIVSYASGGGVRGNVAAGKISEVRAAVAYLKGVFNPIAASGGADVEGEAGVSVRGPQRLRHRERAVAPLDVEWLAREASPAVARARCLPISGPAGHAERGWITVVVVPFGTEAQPRATAQLRRDVLSHLSACVPATVSARIRVADAPFVRVGVRAEVVPLDNGNAAALEERLRRGLDRFLHPLVGGSDGRGWQFGETVHLSQIAAFIEGTDGVDHARELSLVTEGALAGDSVPVPRDALITSGEHELRLTVGAR